MKITLEHRIKAFVRLGRELGLVAQSLEQGSGSLFERAATQKLYEAARDSAHHNPWFTRENVIRALRALEEMLERDKLARWARTYPDLAAEKPMDSKQVAVVMAGNVPLVGFHDFLCVLMAGHRFLGKLSSQDQKLPVAVGKVLTDIEPLFLDRLGFQDTPVSSFDAVIATGSNNSARYFEHYFGRYPHVIRKNRNAVAVLKGRETAEELKLLGEDIFSYFGLGCRNVSKLLVPPNFDAGYLKEAWAEWKPVLDHHKYFNNYEYFKAVFLVNRTPFTDTGFCLLREESSLSSPVSVIHYEHCPSAGWLEEYLLNEAEKIQCVVGNPDNQGNNTMVAFGSSQRPALSDYADNIDTMDFLLNLS